LRGALPTRGPSRARGRVGRLLPPRAPAFEPACGVCLLRTLFISRLAPTPRSRSPSPACPLVAAALASAGPSPRLEQA
jgi:hypothetical protein